jgi:20S proteasome alpha/beta subunit
MLCGYEKDGERAIYTSDRMSLKRSGTNAAVGAGEFVARALMASFPFTPLVDAAKLLAIHTLLHVKERVDGCGGKSAVLIIKNNQASLVDQAMIEEVESEFKKYTTVEARLINYAVGTLDQSSLSATIDSAKAIRDKLQKYRLA